MPEADLLHDDEELVAGRRPVEEAFVAKRPARRLLVVPQRRQALERLVLHATSLRIPVVEVEGGTLTSVAGFDGHQGIALVVEPRVYSGLDDVLARAVERGEPPFVLVLDSLEDPQNVGTLLRSAEAAGVHGVIFPTHHQAPLSPAAVKASAGAVEHLLLCPVDDLPAAMSDLRIRGLRIAAAEADAPLTADEADLRGPLAIIVGSEGQGLSPAVRRRADLAIRIPMRGAISSLNAAVAGSILLFAAVAQRPDREPVRQAPRGLSVTEPVATESPEAVEADATEAAAIVEAVPVKKAESKAGKPKSRATAAKKPPTAKAVKASTAAKTAVTATTNKSAKAPTTAKAAKRSKPAKTDKATPKAATATAGPAARTTTKTATKPAEPPATKATSKPAKKATTSAGGATAAKSPRKRGAAKPKTVAADGDEAGSDDLLPGGPSAD